MKAQNELFEVDHINSIQDMILRSAGPHSDKLALEDLIETPIRKLSYRELLHNILKFGSSLRSIGIPERTHIAIIGENRVQWGVSFLTLMCFNYVVVPIDKNLTENEILNIIHESDAEAIIFSESYAELFSGTHNYLKRLKFFVCMDSTTTDPQFLNMKTMIDQAETIGESELPTINPDDLAEIIFTSGSLGRAKGVMLSQKNLAGNLMDMLSMLWMAPEDRFLSVLPMHHTYECTCGLLCPLYAGCSIHYARSLKTIGEDLQRVGASIVLGVPLLYDKMYKRIIKSISEDRLKSIIVPVLRKATNLTDGIGKKDLKKKIFKELHERFGGNIRIFIAGGAAPDPLVAKGLREFGFNFIQGYGLTETSPILTLNRLDNFKDDAAGLPLPSVELRITDPDENGFGEIYAKGPSVMLGYYKNPELTGEVFEGDWFRTGDVGRIDSEGFLHISGRKKNVILSKSGENVFPEEIEDILNRSEYILESIVYGEKDEKHDEIIAAKIVVNAEAFIELSEDKELKITDQMVHGKISDEMKKINKHLAPHKRIRKFYIREKEFEKTTTQKIKRYLVKDQTDEYIDSN
jgi:long-chain acyl-CoA synthetase